MDEKALYKRSLDKKLLSKELIQQAKSWWKYLLRKWIIILVFGLSGAAIGLVASLLTKPKYTASLSFALIEKSSGGGGLADLASSFGFSGLMGGNNGAFSGDNLLEIIQSRYAVEQTLLTPVSYKGEKKNLVEAYIQFNKLREEWSKNTKNAELRNLSFPIGQSRETFTRTQDSVLYSIYNEIVNTKALMVIRKNKKISIVNVSYVCKDELFSKIFVEKLMDETYRFYSETRTSQSRANINMMQAKADSIKNLYESALYKSAGYSPININMALQFAAVPKIKQENNAQLYATVYAEVLKNLETLKLDLARETPIVQIIDTPRMPLKKDKLGKAKGIAFGGIFGALLIVVYLIGSRYIKDLME
ncbi:MAG: lipopolysaccharide biosynthesis protein [Bacteroidota bacterium]|nr:lipopolysaccharide biosynthesis protein [Bacteroidota bacterium]